MAKVAKDVRNVNLTISISPDMYNKIDILSKQSGVTKSAYVSVLLAESLRSKEMINNALVDFPEVLANKLKEVFKDSEGSDTLSWYYRNNGIFPTCSKALIYKAWSHFLGVKTF